MAKYLFNHPNVDINLNTRRVNIPLVALRNIVSQEADKTTDSKEIVKLLLKRPDIDVNKATELDKTLLLYAANYADCETLELLLKRYKINSNYIDYSIAISNHEILLFWEKCIEYKTTIYRKLSNTRALIFVVSYSLADILTHLLLKGVTALFLNHSAYTNLIQLCGRACVYFIYTTCFNKFFIHLDNEKLSRNGKEPESPSFLSRYCIPQLQEVCFRIEAYLKRQERRIESSL